MGKQHMGYARMRAKISEYKEVFKNKENSKRKDERREDRRG